MIQDFWTNHVRVQNMASIEEQLKKIIVSTVKMSDGLTLQQQLKREVDRLYSCIQKYIDQYYDSYKPEVYERTYRFQGSMYAQDIVDIYIDGNKIKLSILFHDDLANHDSLFSDEKAYVPLLMNDGWTAKKLENRIGRIERFTHFDGIHYIENGIRDFNATNKLGLHIDVERIGNGKYSIESY